VLSDRAFDALTGRRLPSGRAAGLAARGPAARPHVRGRLSLDMAVPADRFDPVDPGPDWSPAASASSSRVPTHTAQATAVTPGGSTHRPPAAQPIRTAAAS
jgi:hypothetical protein